MAKEHVFTWWDDTSEKEQDATVKQSPGFFFFILPLTTNQLCRLQMYITDRINCLFISRITDWWESWGYPAVWCRRVNKRPREPLWRRKIPLWFELEEKQYRKYLTIGTANCNYFSPERKPSEEIFVRKGLEPGRLSVVCLVITVVSVFLCVCERESMHVLTSTITVTVFFKEIVSSGLNFLLYIEQLCGVAAYMWCRCNFGHCSTPCVNLDCVYATTT